MIHKLICVHLSCRGCWCLCLPSFWRLSLHHRDQHWSNRCRLGTKKSFSLKLLGIFKAYLPSKAEFLNGVFFRWTFYGLNQLSATQVNTAGGQLCCLEYPFIPFPKRLPPFRGSQGCWIQSQPLLGITLDGSPVLHTTALDMITYIDQMTPNFDHD